MKVESILLKKFQENSLAHFYHIKNSRAYEQEHTEYFHQWMISLLKSCTQSASLKQQWSNVTDILFVGLEEPKSQYQVQDFLEVFKMQEVKPLQLGHQFIVISHAHKISSTIWNKLLKVLEEPRECSSIFLLNPTSCKLLPTIESRCLDIRLAPEGPKGESEAYELLQKQLKAQIKTHEFIELYKNNEQKQEQLIQCLLGLDYGDRFEALESLLKLLSRLKQSQEFHNSSATRLYHIHQFLTQYPPQF